MAKSIAKEAGKPVNVSVEGQEAALDELLRTGGESTSSGGFNTFFDNDEEEDDGQEGLEEDYEDEEEDEEGDEYFDDDEEGEEEDVDEEEEEGSEKGDSRGKKESRIERRLRRLSEQMEAIQAAQQVQRPEESEAPELPEVDLENVITEDMYEEAMASRDGFMKVVKGMTAAVLEASVRASVKQASKSIQRSNSIIEIVDTFYKENPELNTPAYRKYVSVTVGELQATNPGADLDVILKKAAIQTRKDLKVKRAAVKRNSQKKKKKLDAPRFATKQRGGNRRAASQKGEQIGRTQDQHLADVIKAGRRS